MQDMLVKLYQLPPWDDVFDALKERGIEVRKPIGPEFMPLTDWVKEKYGKGWASEVTTAFFNHPRSCHFALFDGRIIGFTCYDATALGYFGPMAVDKEFRGIHLGKALLLKSLWDMKEKGYGYAIIGGVGPAGFYEKTVNAVLIEGSDPGLYGGMIKG